MSDLVKCLQIPFPKGENTVVDLPVWVLELAGEAADRIEALEAQLAKADALAELLDTPNQSEGVLGQYHYNWGRVDSALTEYRAAREKAQ